MHATTGTAATLAATSRVDRPKAPGNPTPRPMLTARETGQKRAWRYASRAKPCPCCGSSSWCSFTIDGQLIVCRRSQGTAPAGWDVVRTTPQGGLLLARIDPFAEGPGSGLERIRSPRLPAGAKLTHRQCLDLLEPSWDRCCRPQVARLALDLAVAPAVLEQLGVGWRWGDVSRGRLLHEGEHLAPMRDGTGQIVGVHRRLAVPYLRDGKSIGKLTMPGSTSGLFYAPDVWAIGSGPILVVEGMTDTAAALHAGLAAVGRPSNLGGSDQLAELFKQLPAERPILVVGERDQKPDGRWPGRDGAEQTAQRLADALERQVLWALVPEPAKDTREFLTAAAARGLEPEAAGQQLVAHLLEHAVAADPAPKDPELDGTVGEAELVGMSELRQRLRARLMALGEPPLLQRLRGTNEHPEGEGRLLPAVYLCSAPTGTGKSHQALELAKHLERQGLRVVYLSQTHRQSAERVAEATAMGLTTAAADAEISPATCGQFHIARRVRECGLSVPAVLCPGCPLQDTCAFQAAKRAAQEAPVRMACHAMGATDLGHVAARRDAIIIDEDALGALVRQVQVQPKDLVGVLRCLRGAVQRYPSITKDPHKADAADLLEAAALEIIHQVRQASQPGSVRIDCTKLRAPEDEAAQPETEAKRQARWGNLAWSIFGHRGLTTPPASALGLLVDVLAGRITELWITLDKHATGSWDRQLVGIQRHRLPRKMMLLLDATADRATLEQVITASGTSWASKLQHAVQDITPAGRPPDVHQARRLVPAGGDVLVGSKPERAAEVLRGALARIPEQRLGLICHGGHLEQLLGHEDRDDGLLELPELDRLVRVAGHHTADVRGSNSWIREADDPDRLEALVVLGCANVPPSAVRLRLLATGHYLEAAQADGGWARHQVISTAPDGGRLSNPTQACADPVWQEARRQLVHAAMHQACSRSRHNLPQGMPVYCVTTEPMPGMLTEPDPVISIDAQTHYLVQQVAQISGQKQDYPDYPDYDCARVKSLKEYGSKRFDPCAAPAGPVSTGQLIGHLERLGWSASTAKRALASAAQAGLLRQPSRGLWCLPAADQPQRHPGPPAAAVRPAEGQQQPATVPEVAQPPEASAVLEVQPPSRPATVIRFGAGSQGHSTDVAASMPVLPPGAADPPADGMRPPDPAGAVLEPKALERAPEPLPAAAWAILASDSADQLEAWRERVAIMQFDGGIGQLEAEMRALLDLLARHRHLGDQRHDPGTGPP